MPGSNTGAGMNGRAFALLVALAGFMELFDGTVIQTALPAMGRDLGVSASGASVAMAAYFAAAAGAIPICAWLADRLGARVAFTSGIAVFALTSLLCGSATSLGWLIVFRILQGVGGAVMMTVGQIAILRNAPKDQLLRITAFLVWPALAAPVIAPVVGGLITDSLGWRWLFWINVPLGLVGILGSLRLAPRRSDGAPARKLDVVGALLLTVGLFTLIPALGMVDAGAAAGRIGAIVVGVVVLAAAVVWLLRHRNPLLDLRTFRYPTFTAANGSGTLYRAVIASVPVLLTLLFQVVYGWDPVHAGLLVMLIFVGNLSVKPFANYSVRRWGYRVVVVGATLLGAVAIAGFMGLRSGASLFWVLPLLYLSGAARSIGFTALMTMQYKQVPAAEMSTATPLSGAVQQVSTAAGIAVSIGAVSALEATGMSAITAYRLVFAGLVVALLISAVWVWALLRGQASGIQK